MERHEREILSELIDLYCNLPCLWDIGSDLYKDKNQKDQAWQLLANILKKIEPEANVALAKTKIRHMRTAYQREEKKVKESKMTGSGASDVHVPNLWYFKLLSPVFNNKDEQSRTRVKKRASDEDCKFSRKKIPKNRELKRKKHKLIKIMRKPLSHDKKPCSFGVYVGEQLEQIDTFQRQVAEKLISEVLFLAKTGKLQFDTTIVSPSASHSSFNLSNNISHSPSPSAQYIQLQSIPSSSATRTLTTNENEKNIQLSIPEGNRSLCSVSTEHDYICTTKYPSSQNNIPSSSPKYSHTSSVSQPMQTSSSESRISKTNEVEEVIRILSPEDDSSLQSVSTEETIAYEGSASVLKELLIRNKK